MNYDIKVVDFLVRFQIWLMTEGYDYLNENDNKEIMRINDILIEKLWEEK